MLSSFCCGVTFMRQLVFLVLSFSGFRMPPLLDALMNLYHFVNVSKNDLK